MSTDGGSAITTVLVQLEMLLVFLLIVFPAPAASAQQPEAESALAELERLAASDAAIDLAQVALTAAKVVHPDIHVAQYMQKLDVFAREVAGNVADVREPRARLERMAKILYEDQGFADRRERPPDVFVGFDEVLDRKQWNCFGLSLLYVILGERVGLPIRMVSGTGHALVMCDTTPPWFIETTQRGAVHPDTGYLDQYLPYPCVKPEAFRALDARETAAVVLAQTAAVLLHEQRVELAKDLFDAALAFDPRDAEARAGLGYVHLAQGRYRDAIAAFQRAAELNPELLEAFAGLGTAHHALGDLPAAIAAFRRLIALCPEEPKAQFNLGQVLYAAGDLDGAIAAFRAYTALAPRDPDGYARLAFPLEDSGDLQGALEAYRRTIQINPRYQGAHVNMGLLFEKLGRLDDAEASYETARALDPRDALAVAGLGRVSSARGQHAEAEARFQEAIRLSTANAAIRIDYAKALLKSGRAADAAKAVEHAIQLDPPWRADVEGYLLLAEAAAASGDDQIARAAASRAKSLGAQLPPELEALLSPPR